jgi:hypothetical protein
MPWYSSQAQLERETYLGNPLPWIDWVLLAAALASVFRPRLARATAIIALVDVALAVLMMSGDAAEGLEVDLLPGIALATVAAIALLMTAGAAQRRSAPASS